jgi:hypothetical protein
VLKSVRLRRGLLLLLAAILFAYAVWALGTASSFRACIADETKAAADQSKEGLPPIALTIINSAAIDGRCTLHVAYAYRDLMAVVATVFIAVFTGTLWWSTRRLWEAGEKQRTLSEEISMRQLRAYVSSVPNKLGIVAPGAQIQAAFKIKNTGQTPAHSVQQWSAVDILPYPLPPNYPFPLLASGTYTSVLSIPRGGSYTGHQRTTRTFSAAEIEEIMSGQTKRLYVIGLVKYIDVFDKAWETQFCASLRGGPGLLSALDKAKIAGESSAIVEFEASEQHNKAT